MKHRFGALLLALCFLLPLAAPAARAEEEPVERVTVHIGSAAELIKLAADCAYDAWSDNVDVLLDRDIDLSGESFSPIPVFNGSFDGQGHRITGLHLATDGSNQGLFRFLRSKALVQNLRVTGEIAPTVGREYVGGIAGESAGKLVNCEFEGRVSGLNYVGGLVGDNSGSLFNCRFYGEVSGKRFTGGLVGHNAGLLDGCVNYASVNTAIHEAQLDIESLNTVSTVPLSLLSAEDENIVSDTGGVAGYSRGVLLRCVNHGAVGYQHYGYNVGGVAGRQAGYLSGCENYGAVLGRKDVAGVVGQMEPFLALTDSMNLADELILLNQYMNAASADLAVMSAQMRDAVDNAALTTDTGVDTGQYPGTITPAGQDAADSGMTGSISGGSGGGSISGGSGGGSISGGSGVDLPIDTDRANELADSLSGIASEMNDIFGVMSDSAGYLADDLHLANNQFSRVLLLMSNALGGNFDSKVFEDVSDELGEKEIEGRVSQNLNLGSVEGDSNVGGIVGAMGIEYEFDLEDTLAEKVGANGIVNNTYDAKCVCSDNCNRGEIVAKKDRVGGVVGSSEMGVVLRGESYGSVSSTDGGYVGGVVGYAEVPVRFSYAMCDIAGKTYVGGIAGYASSLSDCASMIDAAPADACLGAIAGWADMKKEGAVTRNVFVHDSLGAVDGISYRDLAMPVSYEELVAREELPGEFRTLKLSFLADGVLVKRLSVAYGASVDPAEIPAVPEKEGFSGAWEDFERSSLRFSTTVNAVYTPYQSAVGSSQTREDSPQSIVLVEGEFDENVSIRVEPLEDAGAAENGTVLEAWSLQLDNLEYPSRARYNVRYQAPKPDNRLHTVQIQVQRSGEWRPVDAKANGSYLSFPVSGDNVSFRAVEVSYLQPKLVILLTAAAVSLLGLIVIAAIAAHAHSRRAEEEASAPEGEEPKRDED